MSDEEDCWDAFGSDSDEDEDCNDDEGNNRTDVDADENGMGAKAASSIAMHLSQKFLKQNPQIKLSDRIVAVVASSTTDRGGNTLTKNLEQRQMSVIRQNIPLTDMQQDSQKLRLQIIGKFDSMVDALIIFSDSDSCDSNTILTEVLMKSILCPGGVLIVENGDRTKHIGDSFTNHLIRSDVTILNGANSVQWVARRKKSIRAHASTCPWLSSSHSIEKEEERLQLATVPLSSYETATSPLPSKESTRKVSRLTEYSIRKAVLNMKQYGYCILPGLLDTSECLEWGSAVLDCIHDASKILLERDGVNIYNPQSSTSEPQSYREMSMREDLRMDLRHGPALSKLRARKESSASKGGKSIVLTASQDCYGDGLFLRGHPSLLEIIRRTMNPGSSSFEDSSQSTNNTKPLFLGNIGRWNFGGSGNNGTYQDLRVSPIGGIVSLPGSAEQALHADTPHLFEHIPNLPAHYINVFAPCTAFDESVGGTAFIHGSHNLSFTAQHYDADHNASFYPFLVRPKVSLGDVILFDCRILHFGLANTSQNIERCICYVNTWHDWFHDAKNWDKNRAIFEQDLEGKEERS